MLPLLAAWRYGLGRTAAFTSDFSGRWSASWLAWDQFPRFAAQLVRWIERPTDSNVLHPRIDAGSGSARVTVDAYDSLGAFVNGLEIGGILISPGGARAEIRVPQSGTGSVRNDVSRRRGGRLHPDAIRALRGDRAAPRSRSVRASPGRRSIACRASTRRSWTGWPHPRAAGSSGPGGDAGHFRAPAPGAGFVGRSKRYRAVLPPRVAPAFLPGHRRAQACRAP